MYDFHTPSPPPSSWMPKIYKTPNIRQVVSKQEKLRNACSGMITIPTQQLIPSGKMASLPNQLLCSEAQAGGQIPIRVTKLTWIWQSSEQQKTNHTKCNSRRKNTKFNTKSLHYQFPSLLQSYFQAEIQKVATLFTKKKHIYPWKGIKNIYLKSERQAIEPVSIAVFPCSSKQPEKQQHK